MIFKTKWLLGFALIIISAAPQASDLRPGDHHPLPELKWQDAQGQTHQLKDSHGQARILHFWAAWCIPCREEMPEMLEWKAAHPNIKVIPLSLDNRMAQAKYFIKKNKLTLSPLLINKDDSDALGIPVLPYTLIVPANGTLAAHYAGMAPWSSETFTAEVYKALNLAP